MSSPENIYILFFSLTRLTDFPLVAVTLCTLISTYTDEHIVLIQSYICQHPMMRLYYLPKMEQPLEWNKKFSVPTQ